MRRVVLWMAVWCYSWSAVAIDGGEVTFDDWRFTTFETVPPLYNAWGTAWDGEEMLELGKLVVEDHHGVRTVKSPHCPAGGVCGYEHKYTLTVKSPRSRRLEKMAILVKDGEELGDRVVVSVDPEGKQVVIGEGHDYGVITMLRFVYGNKQVLLRSEDLTRFGDDAYHRIFTLSVVRNDGEPFQWLGHSVKTVNLSAHLRAKWD